MEYRPTILKGGETLSDDQIMAAHESKAARRVSGSGLPGEGCLKLVVYVFNDFN